MTTAVVRRATAQSKSSGELDVSRFSSGPLRPKMVMKETWNGTSL